MQATGYSRRYQDGFQGELGSHTVPAAQRTLRWAILVCLAVFGPYVAGIITGQLAVLLLGMFIVVTGWPLAAGGGRPVLPIIGLWAAICAVVVIASVSRALDPGFYGSQSAVHSMWWLIMPQLVLVISWYWTRQVPPERLIVTIARVTAIGVTANAALAITQLVTADADLGGVLPHFWSTGAGSVATVAGAAIQNGRYTGIFDQPAEAGTAYGVALLCVIYLVRRGWRWKIASACATLVTIGGVLSLSKVFLFAALPIAALVTVRSSGVRLRILAGACAGAAGMAVADAAGLLPAWGTGHAVLQDLLHPSGSLMSLYSANRYGPGGGTAGPVAADVIRAAPWAGFGADGLATPYDSLWLEVLVLSGLIGIALMCAIWVALGWRWLRLRTVVPPAEHALAGSVLLLAFASSLGIPSLTANRVGILIWLILGVLLTGHDLRDGQASPIRP